jgi:hypothetical protein
MEKLIWKNVLYNHGWLGWRGDMLGLALRLGYPYFAWNGLVYDTKTDVPLEKFTVEDVQ